MPSAWRFSCQARRSSISSDSVLPFSRTIAPGNQNFPFVFAQFGVGPGKIERAEKLKPTGLHGFNVNLILWCQLCTGRILNFNGQGMGTFFEQAGIKDLAESTAQGLGIIGMLVRDIGPFDTARHLNGLAAINP